MDQDSRCWRCNQKDFGCGESIYIIHRLWVPVLKKRYVELLRVLATQIQVVYLEAEGTAHKVAERAAKVEQLDLIRQSLNGKADHVIYFDKQMSANPVRLTSAKVASAARKAAPTGKHSKLYWTREYVRFYPSFRQRRRREFSWASREGVQMLHSSNACTSIEFLRSSQRLTERHVVATEDLQ